MIENLKMKATLASDDGGKTWYPSRIFYVSGSESPHSENKFIDSNPFETMVLKRMEA